MCSIGQFFIDLPAIIGGVSNVVANFTEIATGKFTSLGLRIERTVVKARKGFASLTNQDTAAFQKRLEEIDKQLKFNEENALSFTDAFRQGFEETKKEQTESYLCLCTVHCGCDGSTLFEMRSINPHQRCGYSDSPFTRKNTFLCCRVQKWISGNGTGVYPNTKTP